MTVPTCAECPQRSHCRRYIILTGVIEGLDVMLKKLRDVTGYYPPELCPSPVPEQGPEVPGS